MERFADACIEPVSAGLNRPAFEEAGMRRVLPLTTQRSRNWERCAAMALLEDEKKFIDLPRSAIFYTGEDEILPLDASRE